jgi:hypothetical protein
MGFYLMIDYLDKLRRIWPLQKGDYLTGAEQHQNYRVQWFPAPI